MPKRKAPLYKDEIPERKILNIAPIVALLVIMVLLQVLLQVFNVPRYVFPTPLATFQTLFSEFGNIWPDICVTLKEILLGYAIAVPVGILLAILMTQFKIINSALTPYTIFLATMPMIALVPLLMIWLGFGINVKIITVALQSFPVVMLNAITGFIKVDPVKRELMKSLGGTRIQTLRHLIIPSSSKDIFTGLKLGSIFATIAAISSEFTGGTQGLGYQIFTSISFLRTELAFGGIVCISIIGILFYNLITFMERKMIRWAE